MDIICWADTDQRAEGIASSDLVLLQLVQNVATVILVPKSKMQHVIILFYVVANGLQFLSAQ